MNDKNVIWFKKSIVFGVMLIACASPFLCSSVECSIYNKQTGDQNFNLTKEGGERTIQVVLRGLDKSRHYRVDFYAGHSFLPTRYHWPLPTLEWAHNFEGDFDLFKEEDYYPSAPSLLFEDHYDYSKTLTTVVPANPDGTRNVAFGVRLYEDSNLNALKEGRYEKYYDFYTDWLGQPGEPLVIKFDNGSEIVEERRLEAGHCFGLPENIPELPTGRPGYVADYWTYNDWPTFCRNQSIKIESGTTFVRSITVYAHWSPCKCTVEFLSHDLHAIWWTRDYGTELGELPEVTSDKYTFCGWSTGGSNPQMATEKTIVDANWVVFYEVATVNVAFESNGGSGIESRTIKIGSGIGQLPVPTRTGYTFVGWFRAVDGQDQITGGTVFNEHTTCYAHWVDYSTCEVTFDANGGEGLVPGFSKTVVYYGTYGDLPVCAKDGYELSWTTALKGGKIVTSNSVVENPNDHVLYAQWTGKRYVVRFDANGGVCEERSKEVVYNNPYGTLPMPTRQDCEFIGWFSERVGGKQVLSSDLMSQARDIELYAHWKYKLKFNANGGVSPVIFKMVESNEEYGTLPTPEMPGYTFAGWFTAQSGGSAVSSSNRMQTEGATIYAHWTMNKYNIGFDANGGEGAGDVISLRYDTAFTLPKNGYTRLGYKFDGWTTSQGGAKMFEPGASVSKLTAEENGTVTLYAVWIPVPLTVGYARQHYPWNGLADVTVKVEGDAGVNYQVAFQIADADGVVKSVEAVHAVGQTQIQPKFGSWMTRIAV